MTWERINQKWIFWRHDIEVRVLSCDLGGYLAFRGRLLPFYVSQSCWWLRFSFSFYYARGGLGLLFLQFSHHFFRWRIRFQLFWPQIRSGFSAVFRIWLGTSFKFFLQLYNYYSIACIHQLPICTLLNIINYFACGARVSGVRFFSGRRSRYNSYKYVFGRNGIN